MLLDSPSKRLGGPVTIFGVVPFWLGGSGSGWVVLNWSIYYIEVKLLDAVFFKKELIFMTCPLWSNLHQRQLGKTPQKFISYTLLKLLYSVGGSFGLGILKEGSSLTEPLELLELPTKNMASVNVCSGLCQPLLYKMGPCR